MTSQNYPRQKPASSAGPTIENDRSDAPDWFLRIFGALLTVGGLVVLVHVLQLVTATIRVARREHLFGGVSGFTATILIATGSVVLATVCLRTCVALFGSAAARAFERHQLRSSTRRARRSIGRKKELLEERIRLVAQLRATWMFERECYSLANAQARHEFKDALQTGVTRSCEIAFNQIALVVDQYELVLKEIDESELEAADKTELLETLTGQLNVAATEKKNRATERRMDDAIWKLRFETASRLNKNSPKAALRYLQEVESATPPSANRRRLQAKIHRLRSKSQVRK